MYSHSPSQPQRVLGEGAVDGLAYGLVVRVKVILHVLPLDTFHLYRLPLALHDNPLLLIVERAHHTYPAVIIPSRTGRVVLHKHHLGTDFQPQRLLCRIGALREGACHRSVEMEFPRIEPLQITTVHLVGLRIVGRQPYRYGFPTLEMSLHIRDKTAVEQLQGLVVIEVVAQLVEQREKVLVLLTVDGTQLDGDIRKLFKGLALEEER